MSLELALIGGSQQTRFDRQVGPAFQAVKQRWVIEWKVFLRRIDDLPHADIVLLMPQAFQSEQQRIRIREEITEQDDDASVRQAFGDAGEERGEGRG